MSHVVSHSRWRSKRHIARILGVCAHQRTESRQKLWNVQLEHCIRRIQWRRHCQYPGLPSKRRNACVSLAECFLAVSKRDINRRFAGTHVLETIIDESAMRGIDDGKRPLDVNPRGGLPSAIAESQRRFCEVIVARVCDANHPTYDSWIIGGNSNQGHTDPIYHKDSSKGKLSEKAKGRKDDWRAAPLPPTPFLTSLDAQKAYCTSCKLHCQTANLAGFEWPAARMIGVRTSSNFIKFSGGPLIQPRIADFRCNWLPASTWSHGQTLCRFLFTQLFIFH